VIGISRGGDVPGLNSRPIRGVTLRACAKVPGPLGIRHGWAARGSVSESRNTTIPDTISFHLEEEDRDRAVRNCGIPPFLPAPIPGARRQGPGPRASEGQITDEKTTSPLKSSKISRGSASHAPSPSRRDKLSYGVRIHKEGFKVIASPRPWIMTVPGPQTLASA